MVLKWQTASDQAQGAIVRRSLGAIQAPVSLRTDATKSNEPENEKIKQQTPTEKYAIKTGIGTLMIGSTVYAANLGIPAGFVGAGVGIIVQGGLTGAMGCALVGLGIGAAVGAIAGAVVATIYVLKSKKHNNPDTKE